MTYCTATARAEFDRWSRSYDDSILQRWLFGPSHELLLDNLTRHDRRLLDVGCGTGQFAQRVLDRFPKLRVFGLDLSDQMLNKGKPRRDVLGNGFQVVQGDSERLPFADGSFDVVTCSHSFHHYPRQDRVVAEMFRVLRPGGRLMIIDGSRDSLWGWLIFDVFVTLAEGAVHHCSAKRLRKLYRQAGFRAMNQEYRGRLAPYLMTHGVADKPAAVEPLRKAA